MKATTSSNVSALRASFLADNSYVKAKKPFTNGEEMIMPAVKDIQHELVERMQFKRWHVFLFQLAP